MRHVRNLTLLLAAVLMLPLAALAHDNNQRSVDIASAVQVGKAHLSPGTYKVEWNQPGPRVQVNFFRNGKEVASASATLKTNDMQITQDDLQTHKTASNVRVLDELDFAHGKDALVFHHRGASRS